MGTTASRSGRSIEKELFIQASPERVFQALTTKVDLESWFVKTAEIDLRPGGAFRVEWGPEDRDFGTIQLLEPPYRFSYTWEASPLGVTTIRIELSAEENGTRLRLTHTGLGDSEDWDQFYNWLNNGWGNELENLRLWLETGKAKEQ